MYDTNDLVRAMQQMSVGVSQAAYPADVMSGTILSAKPLKVQVEQRFTISGDMLVVPEHLTEHEIKVTVKPADTKKAGEPAHLHEYGGELTVKVKSPLKKGDHVQVIRQHGGQKFLLVGKVV